MSLLFETLRLHNGILHNIGYHTSRLNSSRHTLFDLTGYIDLEKEICIPAACLNGLYKCRVTYNSKITSIDFEPYQPRIITSLRLVQGNTISYNHKYSNREALMELFARRNGYDEILILKNGFITDTSFSNIVFFDGTKWHTPSSPLLQGTMRSYLINNNLITESEIMAGDLKHFKKARLINAMMPLDTGKDISVENINY